MISEGDIIRLKSGGPPMTVQAIIDHVSYKWYRCKWFDGNQPMTGDFRSESIVKVE